MPAINKVLRNVFDLVFMVLKIINLNKNCCYFLAVFNTLYPTNSTQRAPAGR